MKQYSTNRNKILPQSSLVIPRKSEKRGRIKNCKKKAFEIFSSEHISFGKCNNGNKVGEVNIGRYIVRNANKIFQSTCFSSTPLRKGRGLTLLCEPTGVVPTPL